jgi:hypothetical protein
MCLFVLFLRYILVVRMGWARFGVHKDMGDLMGVIWCLERYAIF